MRHPAQRPRATGTGAPEPCRFGTCIPSSRAKDPWIPFPTAPAAHRASQELLQPPQSDEARSSHRKQTHLGRATIAFPQRRTEALIQLTKRSQSHSREELTSVIRFNTPAKRLSQDFVSSACDDKFQIKDTDHMAAITIRGLLAGKASM